MEGRASLTLRFAQSWPWEVVEGSLEGREELGEAAKGPRRLHVGALRCRAGGSEGFQEQLCGNT